VFIFSIFFKILQLMQAKSNAQPSKKTEILFHVIRHLKNEVKKLNNKFKTFHHSLNNQIFLTSLRVK
jgi:hypothetical protein